MHTAEEIPDRADVVIVGAGLAGLGAARQLAAAGVSVVVLEARERVGGRTLSQDLGKGRFDLGAQWLGPTQERVAALCQRFGITVFPTHARGRKLLDLDGRVSPYERSIPSLPLLRLVELHRLRARVDRLVARVPLDRPEATPDAAVLDGMSIDAWTRRFARSEVVRKVLDAGVRTIFGAEPGEVSMLHFLYYCRSGGSLMRLVEIENGAQQDRVAQGAQSLAQGMAGELRGDPGRKAHVVLGAPVRRIAQDPDGVTVASDQGAVRGRLAVVCVPPALAARIDYEPALPAARDLLLQRISTGSTVKCIAAYERAFWRERGFSGEVVCTDGPVTVVFDNGSHDGAQPALLAFVVGRAAYGWSLRPERERQRLVVSTLARYFGAEALFPVGYVEKDWGADPWTRGCPVAVRAPGVWTSAGTGLRAPVGRLHWAGTETATVWNGYMEGALESAERVALEVLARL